MGPLFIDDKFPSRFGQGRRILKSLINDTKNCVVAGLGYKYFLRKQVAKKFGYIRANFPVGKAVPLAQHCVPWPTLDWPTLRLSVLSPLTSS